MREGKVADRVLRRSVLGQLNHRLHEGMDFHPADGPVRAAVCLTEGEILAPQRAFHDPVNALEAAGAKPQAMTLSLVMPENMEEKDLKAFMREMDKLCAREEILLMAGHTAVSSSVSELHVTSTAFGTQRRSGKQEEGQEKSPAGLDIVCAGQVAREGTAMIALTRGEDLLSRYPSAFITEAGALYDHASMKEAAGILRDYGSRLMHSVREGGIFGGLWQLAAAAGVGLTIDLASIPIRQHTIEICEFFSINPYMLMCGGCLLAVTGDGFGAVAALREEGIAADVIGKTTDSNDRIVRYDGESRFLEPPKQDEYYKIKAMGN